MYNCTTTTTTTTTTTITTNTYTKTTLFIAVAATFLSTVATMTVLTFLGVCILRRRRRRCTTQLPRTTAELDGVNGVGRSSQQRQVVDSASYSVVTSQQQQQQCAAEMVQLRTSRQAAGRQSRRYARSKNYETFSVHDALRDEEMVYVKLKGRLPDGLGFDVVGNMTDGIYVSHVSNRGPAYETGLVRPGDRIEQLSVTMRNMVYEDALTLLSYSSSYPVLLQLSRSRCSRRFISDSSLPSVRSAVQLSMSSSYNADLDDEPVSSAIDDVMLLRLTAKQSRPRSALAGHPFFRSQSTADLQQRAAATYSSSNDNIPDDNDVRATDEVTGSRRVWSTSAVDLGASLEFQLIQRQIEILNTSTDRTAGMQHFGFWQQMRAKDTGSTTGLKGSDIEASLNSSDGDCIAAAHHEDGARSRRVSEKNQAQNYQAVTNSPNVTQYAADHYNDGVCSEKSGSIPSDVTSCDSWFPSSTWKFIRHHSSDGENLVVTSPVPMTSWAEDARCQLNVRATGFRNRLSSVDLIRDIKMSSDRTVGQRNPGGQPLSSRSLPVIRRSSWSN